MTKIGRNALCPCNSGLKWKRCHGLPGMPPLEIATKVTAGQPRDPIASWLEAVVRPHVQDMRRAALAKWALTLDSWVQSEEHLQDYDTVRLERLVQLAFDACTASLAKWDRRFALQLVRSLPPRVIGFSSQIVEADQLVAVIGVLTAAAVSMKVTMWPRVPINESAGGFGIGLTPTQYAEVGRTAPQVLGESIGAAYLVYSAQCWYRLAGKGGKIKSMPARLTSSSLAAIQSFGGDGVLVMPGVDVITDERTTQAIDTYEGRKRQVGRGWTVSGLMADLRGPPSVGASDRMWFVVSQSGFSRAVDVHVPALDTTFPSPSWLPAPDLELQSWIGELRPFTSTLHARIGLTVEELGVGLAALGSLVERQTQCSLLVVDESPGTTTLRLEAPVKDDALAGVVSHLLSLLLRGMLRSSLRDFETALGFELTRFGCPKPAELALRFIDALSGEPIPWGLPKPVLFYKLDEATLVLDLAAWHAFVDTCTALASSGSDQVGNTRGSLFEEQVRGRLKAVLALTADEQPWPANREVRDGDTNYGDVDFCFVREHRLFNLDAKSWQRTSDYHIGHYHSIQNRLDTLVKQIGKLELRGEILQRRLESAGSTIRGRYDFIVVATPEYLAPDRTSLWYGAQPRVLTVPELARFVSLTTDGDSV